MRSLLAGIVLALLASSAPATAQGPRPLALVADGAAVDPLGGPGPEPGARLQLVVRVGLEVPSASACDGSLRTTFGIERVTDGVPYWLRIPDTVLPFQGGDSLTPANPYVAVQGRHVPNWTSTRIELVLPQDSAGRAVSVAVTATVRPDSASVCDLAPSGTLHTSAVVNVRAAPASAEGVASTLGPPAAPPTLAGDLRPRETPGAGLVGVLAALAAAALLGRVGG